MNFKLLYSKEAIKQLEDLSKSKAKSKVYKAVLKTLGFMQVNLRHNSLQTHKYSELSDAIGEEVFESYAQNRTPGAYRIFWHYGPGKNVITIISITPHP